jgi:hypothetical protein
MFIGNVETAPSPQYRLWPFTVIFPDAAEVVKLTVMELELLLPAMEAPVGMVQIYSSAPGMTGTEKTIALAGVQMVGCPLMTPAGPGVVPTSIQVFAITVWPQASVTVTE